MTSPELQSVHESCKGVFPRNAQITETESKRTIRRYRIQAEDNLIGWEIGDLELKVALRFDGKASYWQIAERVYEEAGIRLSPEKIKSFERRLLKSNLLLEKNRRSNVARDPLTGMNYGRFHHILILEVFSFKPHALNRIPTWAATTLVRILATLSCALIGLSVYIFLTHYAIIAGEFAQALSGRNWLLLYLLVCASGIFHEGGHIICCLAYGVPVFEVGLATYFLIPIAWTLPDQHKWNLMPKPQRIATICAGPIGSFLFGSIGLVIWWQLSPDATLKNLALLCATAGFGGTIPTLCPMFQGDSYLIMTELFGVENLRTKSFKHLKGLFRKDGNRSEDLSRRKKVLYVSVAASTLFFWATIGVTIIYLACRFVFY